MDWFRGRVPMTKEKFAALSAEARRHAFTVAGAANLQMVTDVWKAIGRAVERGDTFDDFKKSVAASLSSAWGGEKPSRLDTIFRTNVQTAYSHGRWAQMTEPAVLKARPFWRFNAILDSRTTRICRPLEDTILPADDPWWTTHVPPLHFNCRSAIETLTEKQAARDGGPASKPPAVDAAEGFGVVDREWTPDLTKYPKELADVYRQKATAAGGGQGGHHGGSS